jgi:uncharacterized membrane protein
MKVSFLFGAQLAHTSVMCGTFARYETADSSERSSRPGIHVVRHAAVAVTDSRPTPWP